MEFNEAEFDEEVRALVAGAAPRVFAVVQVWEWERDGCVVAWGMAHPDGSIDFVSVDGDLRMRVWSVEWVLRHYARAPGVSVRVEWTATGVRSRTA